MNQVLKRPAIIAFAVYLSAILLLFIGSKSHGTSKKDTESGKSVNDPAQKKSKNKNTPSKKDENMIAIFETNLGTFKIKLFKDKAPKTVENFVGLAEGTKEWTDPKTGQKVKKPFYDGLTFHRVIQDFMIQGGCPLGTGTGGPGYKFEDEFNKELRHNKPGILSMANAGPNTNGSQFFITVANTSYLDDRHTVFGEVTEGMDIVNAISKVKKDRNDKPLEPVVIKTVKIVK